MQLYRIFNKINDKSYIGITKWNFAVRYSGNWQKHTHSIHLKSEVKKYGFENFDYEILIDDPDKTIGELIELEKEFIIKYNSKVPNGFNLTEGGSSETYSFTRTYDLVDANGEKITVKNLSEFCHKNELSYSAMLNMVSGLTKMSQGYALFGFDHTKIVDSKKSFLIRNIKSGEVCELIFEKIPEWCVEKGLKRSGIYNLINDRADISQGWSRLETDIGELRHGKCNLKHKFVELVNDDGREEVIENVFEFCRDNNLYRSAIYELINGKHLKAKGWRLKGNSEEYIKNERLKRYGKEYKLVFENQVVEVKNLSEFCRNKKLKMSKMWRLVAGQLKEYDGWSIYKEDE